MGLLNPLKPLACNTFGTTFSKSHEVDKIENYLRAAQGILEDVRRRVSQEQDRVSLKKNQALRPSNFKVGQKVLIKKDVYMKPKRGQKFHFLWYGPYAIVEVINPNSYRVETGTDTLRHCVFNARDLKPFSERENDYGRIPPLTREAQLANLNQIVGFGKLSMRPEGTMVETVWRDAEAWDTIQMPLELVESHLPAHYIEYLKKHRTNRKRLQDDTIARAQVRWRGGRPPIKRKRIGRKR
ncbi:uncharacterized protein KNAG_0H03860 [Huiozyma naganishii CBS 8797]|uniref:Chromo domain-containing protein n=1 Tax=Huiozyma naganishii (strain ATCC MYA-139 / BCRC 22969 / CBS 8797 / KCTC 17520 / NBRC 10181 / NCYC 3082 / Yp74L-3) TaxID=1071383 RepID=J7RA97_HUIN7|nr:hypothetical protein KNAG_0H03860 [Kazachstania naganishii CBS 8797]CCK71800.1 hypothetical protein KNAG_0H03860 [Kazachstania naganishii CBS 8797]